MARKTLIHKHTNQTTSTGGVLSPKLPTVGTLEKGEIAVNYKNGYETLSIENDAGEVIPFASLEQTMAYTDASVVNADWNATSGKAQILNKPDIPDEKLSSEYEPSALENEDLYLAPGDTYEEAFGKLHKAILDDEETIAASLNELNNKIPTIDTELSETSENPVQNKVITQTILDNEYVTSTALNNLNNRIEAKQNTLISGTNIKTINGNSLLGSGNITISGGGGSSNNFDIIEVNCNFRADINKDGSISLLDATSMTQGGVHGTAPTDDVNNDGSITITDATAINALVQTNSAANILFNLETNPYSSITSSFTNSKIPILRLIFIGGNTFDIFVQKYSNNTYLGEGLYYVDVPANGEGTELENFIKKIFVSISETSAIGIIGSIVTNKGLSTKQNTLVSGTNIKTINNESILGSGNITIQGGSGGSGDENVIEIVKVNGTALTPDANKAVDITVPTPYIMECSGSGSSVTIEEHAYETLSNAISEGRDVYLKKGSYLYALNVYGEDYLYFTHTSGEELFIESVVVYSDDTAESFFNFLRSAYIGGSDVALGAGDKLVITDASHNNYISRSPITFDGSTTTKALTPKGTWEPFLKTAPVTSVNGQTGEVSLTIPSAVTESTVSGWGFTKNTGTYSKPSGGIPKTDLASAVQTSLGLADTALQSHQSIKSINTNNTTAQTANASEAIAGSGTINLHKVAKTGTYSDLIGTPTIPAAVTESTVSGWGFTKNAGTITGITMNGSSKGTSGVVNLGTVLTEHQTLKTINNESIVGSGNLTVSGLPTVSASDNGKILQVVNGAWTLVTPTAIYTGTSTPNNSTGNDGDLYLQTS